MKFWCDYCGEIIDEDEVAEWKEERGEFWGEKCYEKLSGCPHCHNGLEEYNGQDKEGEYE